MSRYNFDFPTMILWLLPGHERRAIVKAYILAGLKRVRSIHDDFIDKVTEWDQLVKYSPGHRIQLEQLLRENFGAGINVINNTHQDDFYCYDHDDPRTRFLFDDNDPLTAFTFDEDAFFPSLDNFTVQVPALLGADLELVADLVSKFAWAGQTFNVVTI